MNVTAIPSKRRRESQNNIKSKDASTTVKPSRGKTCTADFGPTPVMTRQRMGGTGSEQSAVSSGTGLPQALADCSNLQPRQRLDETTSPRLDSKLARRPREQFPCSLQPFRILPPPPGEDQSITVAEANRRIHQAQVLSERQQHFDQLIDLASTGYIPERQCGDGLAQPPLQAAAPEGNVEPAGQDEAAETVAEASFSADVPPQVQNPAPPVAHRSLRIISGNNGVTTFQSRSGRGCIRILRME